MKAVQITMKASILLAALFAFAAGSASAAVQDSSRLADIYRLVRERNPRLQAMSSFAQAKEALESSASLPPDPMLQIGIMNFTVPGLDTNMPNSMAPSIQAMQMVSFPGKLSLSRKIAGQTTAMARADYEETWWDTRTQAAMSFFMLYEADRQIAVMRQTLRLLEDFEKVAKAMYAAGQGRQSDVLRAGVEVARMTADIKRMEAMRVGAAARLNGLLNRPANTNIPSPAYAPQPMVTPALEELRDWAESSRPMLERGRTAVAQAEARTALARKEIWPDPIVGVQYGQRASDMGTQRMGSVMLGFNVPLFAGKRQLRMRDEASAMEQMARADLTDMRAQVDARLGELVADLERTRALVKLYRTEVLPQAKANVTSSFSSYRVGTVDFMTLVDAQMTVNKYEQELYTLLADYGRSVAELEMTIGRELQVGADALIAEVQ